MTLRSLGRVRVAMIGPRCFAVAAPHSIGKRAFAPGSGCEVRRICSVRFEPTIAMDPERRRPAAFDGPDDQYCIAFSNPLYSRLAVQNSNQKPLKYYVFMKRSRPWTS